MAKGFSSSGEALLVFEAQDPNTKWYTKVAAAIQNPVQHYSVIYDDKIRATTYTSLDHLLKRVDRMESSKKTEPAPSAPGVSEIATCPPPGSSVSEESVCSAGDLGWIPGSGRFPGEGNGNPLQYSCLGNPLNRGAWWAPVHGVAESDTTE